MDKKDKISIKRLLILVVLFVLWGYSLFTDNIFASEVINDSIGNLVYSSIVLWAFCFMFLKSFFKKNFYLYYLMMFLIVVLVFVLQFFALVGYYVYINTAINLDFVCTFAGFSALIALVVTALFVVTILIFKPKAFVFMLEKPTTQSKDE